MFNYKKIRQTLIAAWQNLTQLTDTPHAIALGAGVGIAWNFIPSLGVGPILSVVSAKALRGSGIAAVTVNLATGFFIPLYYSLNLIMGRMLTGSGLAPRASEQIHDSLQESLEVIETVVEAPGQVFGLSRITDFGVDFFVGGLANAILAAAAVYTLIWFPIFIRRRFVKKKEQFSSRL